MLKNNLINFFPLFFQFIHPPYLILELEQICFLVGIDIYVPNFITDKDAIFIALKQESL